MRERSREPTVEGTLAYTVRVLSAGDGAPDSELLHELLTLGTRASLLDHPARWQVHNGCGVLSEKLGLLSTSRGHYNTALQLGKSDNQDGNQGNQDGNHGNQDGNQGNNELQNSVDRVTCKMGQYGEIPRTKMTAWSALARMKSGEYGAASSILDTMSGEDVAVFQAVLAWLSRDQAAAKSFLTNVTSSAGKLLKSLLLHPEEGEGDEDAITCEGGGGGECLRCLKEGDEWDPPKCAPHALYTRAKYLITTKDTHRAREILLCLFEEAHYFEDSYDLLFECSVPERRDVERAVHMFPWRKTLRDRLDEAWENV